MSELKIVSKDIALQLKEIGFDWKCYYLYDDERINYYHHIQFYDLCDFNKMPYYSAPTQALICKWFRDKYDIIIQVIFTNKVDKYGFKLNIITGSQYSNEFYNTYEDAEEASIIKAIELIKNLKHE